MTLSGEKKKKSYGNPSSSQFTFNYNTSFTLFLTAPNLFNPFFNFQFLALFFLYFYIYLLLQGKNFLYNICNLNICVCAITFHTIKNAHN